MGSRQNHAAVTLNFFDRDDIERTRLTKIFVIVYGAALHASIVRGLLADGLSVITGQPAPSLERVIPGVFLAPEDLLGPVRGKEGYVDVGGALRLLSPTDDASVTVRIVRSAGADTTTRLQLVAGQVLDLALDELGDGDVAVVVVESGEPVVAAVRASIGNDDDNGHQLGRQFLSAFGERLTGYPPIGESRITFANTGDFSVAVNFDGRDVELPAGGIVTRPVSEPHQIVTTETVFAAVSIRGETIIGNLQVLPTPPAADSVHIRVDY